MKLKWDFDELFRFGDRISQTNKLEKYLKEVTKRLAKELQEMLFNETPVKTGQLAVGWGGAENYAYQIIDEGKAYKIELINRVPYAYYVNYGHYSHNQYNKGGQPYVVKNRTVPYYDGKNTSTYVFGHFFVEKSILKLGSQTNLDNILTNELTKWFRWCVNG